jgi:putative nucleotidyltransferase with HDIG domain
MSAFMPATTPLPRRRPQIQQAESLAVTLQEEFGVPFTLYDAPSGAALTPPVATEMTTLPDPSLIARVAGGGRPQVVSLAPGHHHLILPFRDPEGTTLVAIGTVTGFARTRAEWEQEQNRLARWARAVCERLEAAARQESGQRPTIAPEVQQGMAWETLLALDGLLRRLRPHGDAAGNQKRILAAAAQLLGAEALAWVPQAADGPVIVAGEPAPPPRECRQLATLLDQGAEWDRAGILIQNEARAPGWGTRPVLVHNLMALRVLDPSLPGWVIAFNKRTKDKGQRTTESESSAPGLCASSSVLRPFRKADAALLTPFLALMGLHLRVSRRSQELKDLLVGLTRSLTSAIDAKDPYTYGHSERVARVAVELGRQMGLPEEQLSDVYLAGLLHDIGKIGVRDAVLGKAGPLSDEERQHIRQHVTIGYQILADLRSINHLLPGVLYHHERWDGQGYPDGLAGEAIPLLARILAVADSYDAMSTSRPYRAGLPAPRVEEMLRDGTGKQWDGAVVEAFGRARPQIHAIRQRGLGDSLRHALDGALREHNPPDASTLCPDLPT